jgi:hypothetical protein
LASGEIVVSNLPHGPRPGAGFPPFLDLALFLGNEINSPFRRVHDVTSALACLSNEKFTARRFLFLGGAAILLGEKFTARG